MAQLKDIRDIENLDIKGLDEVISSSTQPGRYKSYKSFEKKLKSKGIAPSFSAFFLYEHQFNGKTLRDLAKMLGIKPYSMKFLLLRMNIPTRNRYESRNAYSPEALLKEEEQNGAKIYYLHDGKMIPFSKFLNFEKVKRGLTWDQFEELCQIDLRQYAYRNNGSVPNNPTQTGFKKIIGLLGYSQDSFFIKDSLKSRSSCSDENSLTEKLRIICEDILETQRKAGKVVAFNSTAIRKFAGEVFLRKFAYSEEERRNLYARAIQLNPRFRDISFNSQKQDKAKPISWNIIEKDIVENAIKNYNSIHPENTGPGRIPHGLTNYVFRILEDQSPNIRSKIAVRSYLEYTFFRNKKS